MCSLWHPNSFLSDILLSSSNIWGPGFNPSWQSPGGGWWPGWGGLCNPAVMAASAQTNRRLTVGSSWAGQPLSALLAKAWCDGFLFTPFTRFWINWTKLASSLVPLRPQGQHPSCVQTYLYRDNLWNRERRNRPTRIHPSLPSIPAAVQGTQNIGKSSGSLSSGLLKAKCRKVSILQAPSPVLFASEVT